MVAICLLLLCFEPATTAASMAMDGPKTIGDAPAFGPERSGGRCRGDFLASRGMGVSPGEESRKRRRCGSDDRGAAGLRPDQAIKEARCVRALNHKSGRRWRVSVRLDKRSERFGAGKETAGGKSGIVSAKSQPQAQGSSIVSIRWGRKPTQFHRSAPRRAATISRSSSTISRSRWRSIQFARRRAECGLHPALVAAAEERRVKLTQSSSRRLDWAGLRKDGQPRPRRAANEGRAEASEDLAPGKRRHPNL